MILATDSPFQAFQGFLLIFLLVGLYVVPTIIGFRRGHQNAAAIAALNLLLGWTLLGWVAALVWALTDPGRRLEVISTTSPAATPPKPSASLVHSGIGPPAQPEWTAECSACRSRVHPEASVCPYCHQRLAAER